MPTLVLRWSGSAVAWTADTRHVNASSYVYRPRNSGWRPDLNDGVRMNIRPFMKAQDVGKKGAGILRTKPNIKWEKDRGKEPLRDEAEFPWFYNGSEFTGNRMNDVPLSLAQKKAAQTNA